MAKVWSVYRRFLLENAAIPSCVHAKSREKLSLPPASHVHSQR